MQQCMSPLSYLSYVDATDAMWSDEARVGRAMAEQHRRLTVSSGWRTEITLRGDFGSLIQRNILRGRVAASVSHNSGL